MAYTIHCGKPWPHEVKAFHEIQYVLQNDRDWVIITNSGAHEPDANETDIVLIGRLGIIVVELKHWIGHVTSHLNTAWTIKYPNGIEELRKNPLDQAREGMFKLRKLFTDFGIDGRDFFISYMVVLTHPESQLSASSPKVANLVTSLKKFRPGLYEHIRVHQRPTNERSFGPDHIERLLNALEIDYKDIRRAIEYLHGNHKQSRTQPNLTVPAQLSKEEIFTHVPEARILSETVHNNDPSPIHAHGEQPLVAEPGSKGDAKPDPEEIPSEIHTHITRLKVFQIARHTASFPAITKANTATHSPPSAPLIKEPAPVQNNPSAMPEQSVSIENKVENKKIRTTIKPARTVEESVILQSFSHGRSKDVKVEVYKSSVRRRSRLFDIN